MKIAMTGASGNMGREALKQTLELDNVEWVRVLLSLKKKNNKLAKNLKKQYKEFKKAIQRPYSDRSRFRKGRSGVPCARGRRRLRNSYGGGHSARFR